MKTIEELNHQYAHFIAQLPGYNILKTCDARYIAINDDFAKMLGHKNSESCIGFTDYDMKCESSSFADTLLAETQETIENGQISRIYVTKFHDEKIRILFGVKKRFHDADGNIIGVLSLNQDVTSSQDMQNLVMENMLINKYHHGANKFKKINLKEKFKQWGLTPRESEVLFYLARNKKPKAIAALLFVQPKTIEKHIQNIYEKTGCHLRKQIIDLAHSSNITHCVLESIFKKTIGLSLPATPY